MQEPKWVTGHDQDELQKRRLNIIHAYNYYNDTFSVDDAISFIAEHLENRGNQELSEFLRKYNVKNFIPQTIGFLCRMLDNGLIPLECNDEYYKKWMCKIEELSTRTDIDILAEENSDGKKIRRRNRKRTIEDFAPKFLVSDDILNITSIPWLRIKSSSELWTFNTKKRTLNIYRSSDTLDVKGTTLQNVKYSISKTIRKPEDIIPAMVKISKDKSLKLFKDIKAKEQIPKNRLNADTLLLRAF